MGTYSELPDGVEVVSGNGPIVTVEMTCAGCGDHIRTVEMFEDRLSELEGEPLHDTVSCAEQARGGA